LLLNAALVRFGWFPLAALVVTDHTECAMLDVIVLALGCGFFVLFAGYVALCERL
jgi:hypothetical protein